MNRLVTWRYEFAIIAARFLGWEFGLTTPLTIYRFGLRGNNATGSTRKHRFRTKKHQKVNKSSQKTMAYLFGYWRPGVRISTLRPKKRRTAPYGCPSLFCRCGWWELHSAKQNGGRIPSEAVGSSLTKGERQEYSPSVKISTQGQPLKSVALKDSFQFKETVPTDRKRTENVFTFSVLFSLQALHLWSQMQIVKYFALQNVK